MTTIQPTEKLLSLDELAVAVQVPRDTLAKLLEHVDPKKRLPSILIGQRGHRFAFWEAVRWLAENFGNGAVWVTLPGGPVE